MFFMGKIDSAHLSMDEARLALERDATIELIDVRAPEEYRRGHIPGSRNIPLDRMREIEKVVPNHSAKLFVYCLSGARSANACAHLMRMGYRDVTNIGGITGWRGAIETGELVYSGNA